MGYVASDVTHFAINQAATSQDMLEMIANIVALKEFGKEKTFGGDPSFRYTNTAYQSVIFPVFREIDGTNLSGLTFELHLMGAVTSGDTAFAQLWDRTAGAQIVEISFNSATMSLVKSASFNLASALHVYEVRVKATTGGAASPFSAYGFAVIQK